MTYPALKLDSDERSGFLTLGLTRIIQIAADKTALFDDGFIPPCVDCRASAKLLGYVNELEGLLHQRGEGLAGLVSESGRGGAAEIADFLMLQTLARRGHPARSWKFAPGRLVPGQRAWIDRLAAALRTSGGPRLADEITSRLGQFGGDGAAVVSPPRRGAA